MIQNKKHIIKGKEYSRGLKNWLVDNADASQHDRLVAQSLLDDLGNALGRLR